MTTLPASRLNFIESNPSIAAYDSARKNAQEEMTRDLLVERAIQANAEDKASAGSRLRKVKADADTAVAGANVATAVVPSEISIRESAARTAKSGADVASATTGDKIAVSGSERRLANVRADVGEATKGDTIDQSASATRRARAGAVEGEIGNFYKVLDHLNTGDVEGATQAARMAGFELTPEIINDTAWRTTLSGVATRAKELYPNRPRDQQAYIDAQVSTMRKLKDTGQARVDVAQRLSIPAGAPQIPASTEQPSVHKVKDAAGNESLVQARSDGTFRAITPEGMPAADREPANPYAPDGKQTEGQANASLYARRMFQAETVLRDPEIVSAATSQIQRGLSNLPGAGAYYNPNSVGYQKYEQAQRDFINAVLRRESGAVIIKDEFDNARRQYFPAPGDSSELIEQKQRNREEAIRGIAGAAGQHYRAPYSFKTEYDPRTGITRNVMVPYGQGGPAAQSQVAPPTPPQAQPQPSTSGAAPISAPMPALPARLQGSGTYAYSPSRQQFRSADGRIFDLNGNLVTQ